MSRIAFTTNYRNQKVEVIAGWDNPLQTYFLDIMVDNDEEQMIYCSMMEDRFGKLSLRDIGMVLERKGILAPTAFFERLGERSRDDIHHFGVIG